MNPLRDAIIIIGLIIALAFIVVLIRSAGNFSGSFAGSTLRSPGIPAFNVGNSSGSAKAERPKSDSQLRREKEKEIRIVEKQIEEAEAEIALIEQEIENIKEFGETSPYKGMVTITKRSGALKKTDVDDEHILLKASTDNGGRINITGWRLVSGVTSRTVEVPQAVRLIFSGTTGTKEDVSLDPGDSVYITTGRSPIGSSFLINKCTGYFTQFQDFNPKIRESCPDPEEEIYNFYTRDESIFLQNNCLDYIEKMSTCEVETKPLPITLTPSCHEAIIEEVNYNACVENHKSDVDFYQGEWRIFLKRSDHLWRDKREIIKLLDENGLTVDYYDY